MTIDAERWDFAAPRHCHLHNPCEQKRPKSRSNPPEPAGGIEMKFHPQPATPLELLSAGNLAKKLALLDVSPFFCASPLRENREKKFERVLFLSSLELFRDLQVTGEECFSPRCNASRGLFTHDNSVLSTASWRREGRCFPSQLASNYSLLRDSPRKVISFE